MASQTLVVSSFTTKLAAFNSRSTTRPQLALPKSPPALNYRSSSLPTPSLHLKPFNFKSDFKCQVSTADQQAVLISVDEDGKNIEGGYVPIPDVEHNEYVQSLGQFAVDEANKDRSGDQQITFMRVVEAEQKVVAGMNYKLWIQGSVKNVDLVVKAVVFVGLPVRPKNLKSFVPVEWAK